MPFQVRNKFPTTFRRFNAFAEINNQQQYNFQIDEMPKSVSQRKLKGFSRMYKEQTRHRFDS